jgi:hypothetical protein
MTRQIRFNAFDMNCVGHQSPGLWAHPRDRSWDYKVSTIGPSWRRRSSAASSTAFHRRRARRLRCLSAATSITALRRARRFPVNDPLQLVPAMALVTKHLGFGVTASLSFEHPYTFARRMSTLDHLTKGRAAGTS